MPLKRDLVRRALIPLVTGLTTGLCCTLPAVAQMPDEDMCAPESPAFFSCNVPEHNALIQICRNASSGQLTYTYVADGKIELSFSGGAASGAVDDVRGMNGWSYYTGLSGGGPFFAIFVAEKILLEDLAPAASKVPNPAVLQVYDSVDALEKAPKDFIARRVCDPWSINIDREWFGPG